jgi:hypothetical protein
MYTKSAIGFAVVALIFSAAAFQSASANYAPCYENPEAPGCPMARTHESTLPPAPGPIVRGQRVNRAYYGGGYGYRRYGGYVHRPAY